MGGLLGVLGLLGLAAGLVGAVTGTFPLWWGLLAAGLCLGSSHLVVRHAFSRLIPAAKSPEAKRARKELLRRLLACDDEVEAEIETGLRDHDGPEGEPCESAGE